MIRVVLERDFPTIPIHVPDERTIEQLCKIGQFEEATRLASLDKDITYRNRLIGIIAIYFSRSSNPASNLSQLTNSLESHPFKGSIYLKMASTFLEHNEIKLYEQIFLHIPLPPAADQGAFYKDTIAECFPYNKQSPSSDVMPGDLFALVLKFDNYCRIKKISPYRIKPNRITPTFSNKNLCLTITCLSLISLGFWAKRKK